MNTPSHSPLSKKDIIKKLTNQGLHFSIPELDNVETLISLDTDVKYNEVCLHISSRNSGEEYDPELKNGEYEDSLL